MMIDQDDGYKEGNHYHQYNNEEELGLLRKVLDSQTVCASPNDSGMSSGRGKPNKDKEEEAPSPAGFPSNRDDSDESSLEGGKSDPEDREAANIAEPGGAVDPTRFPWKLHRMLTEIETGDLGLEDIVSWQPHGRCK
jgi:hypothetical protein